MFVGERVGSHVAKHENMTVRGKATCLRGKIKTKMQGKVKLLKSITKIAGKVNTSLRAKATIEIVIYLLID